MNAARQMTADALSNTLRTISAPPSLEQLRALLERAERDLMRADYCESTARAIAEAEDAKRRIRALSAQIERLEESL